jgi:hypothetical protein
MAYGRADEPRQPFPGLIVDLVQLEERAARATRFARLYKPNPFTRTPIPPAAQAQAKPPAVKPVFCQCGSQAEGPIPPGLYQCKRASCRRQWRPKP